MKDELVVRSSEVPRPVSYISLVHGPSIEFWHVSDQWVLPKPFSHEWSAWCKPNVHRPVTSHSSSVDVGPPSVGQELDNVPVDDDDRLLFPGLEDLKDEFGEIFVQCYG